MYHFERIYLLIIITFTIDTLLHFTYLRTVVHLYHNYMQHISVCSYAVAHKIYNFCPLYSNIFTFQMSQKKQTEM